MPRIILRYHRDWRLFMGDIMIRNYYYKIYIVDLAKLLSIILAIMNHNLCNLILKSFTIPTMTF